MQLSSSEKGWLPWFGKTGKFSMGWACRLNRASYPQVEQTFEAIAQTRVQLLHEWVREQWEHLADLAEQVAPGLAQVDSAMLRNTLAQAEDFPSCLSSMPTASSSLRPGPSVARHASSTWQPWRKG